MKTIRNIILTLLGAVAFCLIFSEDTPGSSLLDLALVKIAGFTLAGIVLALTARRCEPHS